VNLYSAYRVRKPLMRHVWLTWCCWVRF